jgi:2Fe-2S ferredoxin
VVDIPGYNEGVPKVTFANLNRTVEFETGKLPYDNHGKPESILDVAMHFGIQLEHACGGKCACTTCHVIVKNATDGALSEADEDEEDRLYQAPGLTLHSRLGCQAVVTGDVVVEIPSWNINYVSEGGGSMNLGDAIPPPKNLPHNPPPDGPPPK